MPQDVFQLPSFFDYAATLCWATSGAMLAARKGYDVVGIFVVALVSATGGGLLRDGIFLHPGPPALVQSPYYLELVVAGTILVWLAGARLQRISAFDEVVAVVDALGLGAYAVVGMDRASAAGLRVMGVILVGVVNAVGGGVLRDILLRQEPTVMRPGTLTAIASLSGCLLFLGLTRGLNMSHLLAAWLAITLTAVVRLLAIRYNLQTKPVSGFESYWQTRE